MSKVKLMIFLLFFLLKYNSNCQEIKSEIIYSEKLSPNISWNQIISNSQVSFIVGFSDEQAQLYNYKTKEYISLSELSGQNTAFMSDSNIYLGTIGNLDSNNNKVLKYKLNGEFCNNIDLYYNGGIVDFSFDRKNNRITYLSLKMNEFLNGKTSDSIFGGVYTTNSNLPVILINYKQPSLPNRVVMPIYSVSNKFYLALENKYEIDIYSLNGKNKQTIVNHEFINAPYTSREISYLKPMEKIITSTGVKYPPVIKRIDVNERNNDIIVTRNVRPGSKLLLLDFFNIDNKLYKKVKIELELNEILVDSRLVQDLTYGCLLYKEDSNQYRFARFVIE